MILLAACTFVVAYGAWRAWRLARADGDLTLLGAFSKGIPKDAFEDKVVWVTGASSGIGEAIAVDLCARGAKVVLSARRVDRLQQVKERCKGKNAGSVFILQLDLEKYETHAAAAQAVVDKFGRIDILVNNGGRSQRALVESTSLKVDQEMMALNVIGTISITKATLPHMLRQGGGQFIVISSVAGKMAAPVSASYSASKHALQKVGEHSIDDSKKMTAERCAELVAAAAAHSLDEAWISRNPILLFTYISQYFPATTRRFAGKLAAVRVNAFRQGNKDINAGISLKLLFGRK